MKVAISANQEGLDFEISPIFGRCNGFVIAELIDGKIKSNYFIENNVTGVSSGAGVATSQKLLEEKIDAVISGNFGPNAFMVLNQSKVKLYKTKNILVREALEKLVKNELEEVNSASTQSKNGLQ